MIQYFIDLVYEGFVILSNKSFEEALNNSTSPEYQALKMSMEDSLTNQFCDGTYSNCTVKVIGFYNGSVITNFTVTVILPRALEASEIDSEKEVKKHLDAKMSNLSATITDDYFNVTAGYFTPGNLQTSFRHHFLGSPLVLKAFVFAISSLLAFGLREVLRREGVFKEGKDIYGGNRHSRREFLVGTNKAFWEENFWFRQTDFKNFQIEKVCFFKF